LTFPSLSPFGGRRRRRSTWAGQYGLKVESSGIVMCITATCVTYVGLHQESFSAQQTESIDNPSFEMGPCLPKEGKHDLTLYEYYGYLLLIWPNFTHLLIVSIY